ncbi:MAG: NAD-dependent epimerase/dehydratase family protein [Sphingobacteriales bacterium]|nr:MAG: NAD-dependent epimerase/dehydratase family protein [Sphingobacteriales bacterium]
MKPIVITGGNGFLGRNICKAVSEAGLEAISISRSGKPADIDDSEYEQVQWLPADIFEPHSWSQTLKNAKAVIHCVGILEEDATKGFTHQRMIYETARIAGIEAEKAGVEKFVFVSASAGPPGTPDSYIACKRKAEDCLSDKNFELAILCPGMLYGKERPDTIRTKNLLKVAGAIPIIGKKIREDHPLEVDVVAHVALMAALDETVKGILTVQEMDKLYKEYYGS